MTRWLRRIVSDARGFSLVELLVAIVIFVLLVLTIDVVFATVNRNSRTAELAADVAQNGRVAIERLTREVRFSGTSASEIQPSPPFTGSTWIAFKSARLVDDPTKFCVDATDSPDDDLRIAACGGSNAGTYRPLWQNWIVYCFNSGVLRRDEQPLSDPSSPSQTTCQAAGDIIAASGPGTTFSVSLSGSVLTAIMNVAATERVQGSPVPTQTITLTSRTYIRN